MANVSNSEFLNHPGPRKDKEPSAWIKRGKPRIASHPKLKEADIGTRTKPKFSPLCKVIKIEASEKAQTQKWKPVVDGCNVPEGMQPIQDAQTKINNIVVDPKNYISRPSHEPGLLVVPPEIKAQRSEKKKSSPEFRAFLRAESKRADLSNIELREATENLKVGREARREAAETTRLVNTRKSPTTVNERPSVARIYAREWSGETRVSIESFIRDGKAPDPVMGDRWTEKLSAAGVRAVIDSGAFVSVMRGGYSTFITLTLDNEARERVNKIKPMVQIGSKGELAGEIKTSGKFCHIGNAGDFCNGERAGGLFVPVDFTSESTIGREVSRFLDGLQKMYQRGCKFTDSGDLFGELPPSKYAYVKHSEYGPVPLREKLDYMWVAENPPVKLWNVKVTPFGPGRTEWKAGHSQFGPVKAHVGYRGNPHVHLLMRWRVPKNLFKAWAGRIEKLWGQGFAHIEKIREPEAAAGYLLKAASYLTKSDYFVNPETGELLPSQGVIRGNRYNISQVARAPKFECIAEFQAQEMARIIYDTGVDLQWHHERLKQQIKEAREGKKSNIADIAVIKRLNLPEKTKQNKILAAETRIKKAEARIKALSKERTESPYGNKFRVTVKSQLQFARLLHNAIVQRGWKPNAITTEFRKSPVWATKGLPDWVEKHGASLRDSVEYQLRDRECYWNSLINEPIPAEIEPPWSTVNNCTESNLRECQLSGPFPQVQNWRGFSARI